jgi:hypothetical protein
MIFMPTAYKKFEPSESVADRSLGMMPFWQHLAHIPSIACPWELRLFFGCRSDYE